LDALRFYEPLLPHRELLDSRFFFDIALCYQGLDRMDDVRAAINHIRYGENNPMAQIGLAKLYRAQGRLDLMWRLCLELKKFNMHDILEQEGLPLNRPKNVAAEDEARMLLSSVRKPFKRSKLKRRPGPRFKSNTARKQAELLRDTIIKSMYVELKGVEDKMKQEDPAASSEWMRIAAELYEEFQSQGRFFSKEKSKPYMGDGWLNRELRADGFDLANPKRLEFERPKEWRNILLDDWTEFLSHYAVCLALNGRKEQSAEVIKNIENSTVIYPEPDRYFLVRVASLRRSIIVNDEEKALEECRWFSKRYELASDSCRLPSAVARALDVNPESFRAGPEQKFWMRQIKVMDFSLLDEKHRNVFQFSDGNRVKWTDNGRTDGNLYKLKELDPELLALYGHQMLVGGSPITALNYYFRAYALKPDDAIINLCLGLAYVQLAFKRQSINRQYQLQQGLAFITRYRSKRMERPEACYKQEAEFNMGVIWHSLGLMHLALPAYDRCLELADQVRREKSVPEEDFAIEAAYAKRCILATNGDLKGALKVTKEYLVL
jgi:general transcription factor 3C polypeptide 3 (transcription factor C subunit 4)